MVHQVSVERAGVRKHLVTLGTLKTTFSRTYVVPSQDLLWLCILANRDWCCGPISSTCTIVAMLRLRSVTSTISRWIHSPAPGSPRWIRISAIRLVPPLKLWLCRFNALFPFRRYLFCLTRICTGMTHLYLVRLLVSTFLYDCICFDCVWRIFVQRSWRIGWVVIVLWCPLPK